MQNSKVWGLAWGSLSAFVVSGWTVLQLRHWAFVSWLLIKHNSIDGSLSNVHATSLSLTGCTL